MQPFWRKHIDAPNVSPLEPPVYVVVEDVACLGNANFAGDDDSDRAYSTAMCVLTLEVYYRYFTPLLEVR